MRAFHLPISRSGRGHAAAHGYLLAYLETASFQALPFYEGLGYSIFGELPEISEGHTLYFLKKDLNASA